MERPALRLVYNPIIQKLSSIHYNLLSLSSDHLVYLLHSHNIVDFDSYSIERMRHDFVRHIFRGDCFSVSGESNGHCYHVARNFVGYNTLVQTLLDKLILDNTYSLYSTIVDVAIVLGYLSDNIGRGALCLSYATGPPFDR